MRSYYAQYYRDQLGLFDWRDRVENRLNEEAIMERYIANVEEWTNQRFRDGHRVLVVGAGTGAEFFAFSRRGCDVYGIEPNETAVNIARLKARLLGVDEERLGCARGESLPFPSEDFELVWCFTVLEHVDDVPGCIGEMIRVTKPRGYVFIVTPDYRQFYEGHYKMTMPMFAPKWMLRLWLRLRGRSPEFLRTLRFVTSRQLANIFRSHPVTAFQLLLPWPDSWKKGLTVQQHLIKAMTECLGIQREQFWLLQKMGVERE